MAVPRRAAIVAIAATLGLVLAVVVLLPELARRALVAAIESRIVEPVSIADVDLNPLTGQLRITGLRIGGEDGGSPLLRIPTLDTELRYWPLLRGRTVLGYLTLHQPELRVVRTGPVSFNVAEAWRRPDRPGQGAGATVQALSIHHGTITFLDRTESPSVARRFTRIELSAGRVSTATGLRMSPTSFQAAFSVGTAGTIEIDGSAAPFARPREVQLRVRAARLDPSLLAPYLPQRPRIEPGEVIAAEAHYVLAADGGGTTEHAVTGRLVLGPLRVYPPNGGDPPVALAGVVVEGARIDLLADTVSVREITLQTPRLEIARASDGQLDLRELFPARVAAREPAASDHDAPLDRFTVGIERVRVTDGAVRLVDRSTSPEVLVPVEDVALDLTGLDLAAGSKPAVLSGRATLGGGRLELRGAIRPAPIEGIVAVRATDVPFDPFAPYADRALGGARADVGSVDGVLSVTFEGWPPAASVTGRLLGREVAIRHDGAPAKTDPRPLVQAERLVLDIGRIALGPAKSTAIDRVHVDRPTIRLSRRADGTFDLAALASGDGAGGPPQSTRGEDPTGASSGIPAAWSIARLDVSDGAVKFTDESVDPTFTVEMERLDLSLRHLAPGPGRARLTLDGRLGGSRLTLAGWLTPFAARPAAHLEGTLDGYALPQLGPYTAEYLGYRIRRGRLTADVEFTREPGGFDSIAQLSVRQIQLGDRVSDTFRERVGIPLTLALDLLEGIDGTIRLRVPVSGQLTNPRFSVGDAVWRALRNTIVKLVAAPLRTIGSVVTLGGRIGRVHIDSLTFPPGSAELDDIAERRLAEMAGLVRSKPRLELEIRGSATAADTTALKERRLRDRAREAGSGDYEAGLARLYEREKGFGEPGSAVQSGQTLLDTIDVSRADLRELASVRAAAVQEALVGMGVDGGRLYVVRGDDEAVASTGPGRVRFEIL